MKRIIAMMMVLGMMFSIGTCGLAEELGIDTSVATDIDTVIEDTGVPTYDGIKMLWKEAEDAYSNENWEEAVLKYLECASKSYVMENALMAPILSMSSAKNVSHYTMDGMYYEENEKFWSKLTGTAMFLKELADAGSYVRMANACRELTAVCELKAGVCYYNMGESKQALICFNDGFGSLSLGWTIEDFSEEEIDVDALYMTEFIPVYNELLGLSEVFTFE